MQSNDDISIANYVSHVVPRDKGGGIVIYFKDSLQKICSVVGNVSDSIVIVKCANITPSNDRDAYYLLIYYFPPVNSTYYDRNYVDLFVSLEDSISKYKDSSNVIVIGDFNSRKGVGEDSIVTDYVTFQVMFYLVFLLTSLTLV